MTIKLTCQVCQHPNIEGNSCPNCETDLTLIRMLMELPVVEGETVLSQSTDRPVDRYRNNAFVFLLTGLILGVICAFAFSTYSSSRTQIATHPTPTLTTSIPSSIPIASSPIPSVTPPEQSAEVSPATCTGFRYIVRPGDSLTLIAWRLYGDANLWTRIAEVNPKVRDQGDILETGEAVLVPDREAACP